MQEDWNSLAVWSDKRKRVPLRKNEAGVNANMGKPMKTVFRCISRGLFGSLKYNIYAYRFLLHQTVLDTELQNRQCWLTFKIFYSNDFFQMFYFGLRDVQ